MLKSQKKRGCSRGIKPLRRGWGSELRVPNNGRRMRIFHSCLGRVTSPGDGAGGKAVIRKKSEGMGCLCTCAHTHAEFSSAQKCFDMSSLPAPPHHTLVLTPASYYSYSDAQQARNCFKLGLLLLTTSRVSAWGSLLAPPLPGAAGAGTPSRAG